MALIHCPECRLKISESSITCPHCGFSFDPENLEMYKQKLEQYRLENQEVNRKSAKLHFIWLVIFSLVILTAAFIS
ncbi:zinc ribbon domain-containing protein [Rodentibacter caecimuris]|uniref:UPF0547 domain-containing protein n=1 Tax=Rodentibacter caecimuris TaxID=1796644 RepID=A0ABX3KZ04_9PAST|nr:hypothetical protein BKG89_04255 [Rodentibacter heylii]